VAINDFIKGGQTFSQNWRMFFDIFWKVITIFFLVWLLSFASLIYLKTTPYQRDQAVALLEAEPLSFLFNNIENGLNKIGLSTQNNPENDAKINYKTPNGNVENITVDEVIQHIATPHFIRTFTHILFWNAIEGLLISMLLTVIIAKLLIRYGKSISEKKVLRGTFVCAPCELTRIITKRHKGEVSELSIAGIPLPKNAETQHIWINGTTGAGKTVAFSDMMSQIRTKHRRAVVYDMMGVYVARFYRPGRDIILNPFDMRFPGWKPWVECSHSVDYEMLAASQIPITPNVSGEDPFWKKAARSLYSATLRRLEKEGKARNLVLLRYLLTSDLDKLRELLKNTEAESLVSKDLEKTALSVKAILNDYIKGMRFLNDDGPMFSIRAWVRRSDDDSWIFITSRPDYHETLMPLISTWYDIAITEALSLPDSEDRRIYFPLDELPTLQYLPALKKGMPLGRQKGLCFILGTQDLSQLRVNYGADNANSLIGNANNKLILRTVSDADSISNLFSKSEYQENTESLSYGVTDNRDGVSISKQRNMQSIVLPSELQNLDDLAGYLRVPGNYPIAKVQLNYVKYDELNERLIPREDDIDWLVERESDIDFGSDVEMTGELEEKDLYQQNKKKLAQHIDKDKSVKAPTKERQGMLQLEMENANTPLDKNLDDDNYKME